MDPFHRSMSQSNGDGGRPPHYTKTRAPAISSQTRPRNGHLSVSAAPMWTEAPAQHVRKMGVASLLFHRTLSSKDTLLVQSYTSEKQQDHHKQLQIHSYAKEQQPRRLQSKACTLTQVQALPMALGQELAQLQPGTSVLQIQEKLNESQAHQNQNNDKPEKIQFIQDPARMEKAKAEARSPPPQSQTQLHDLSKVKMEASRVKKRKVCVS